MTEHSSPFPLIGFLYLSTDELMRIVKDLEKNSHVQMRKWYTCRDIYANDLLAWNVLHPRTESTSFGGFAARRLSIHDCETRGLGKQKIPRHVNSM